MPQNPLMLKMQSVVESFGYYRDDIERPTSSVDKTLIKGTNDMNIKQHLKAAADHNARLGKSHSALASAYRKVAEADDSRADFKCGKLHKSIADLFGVMSESHASHAEQLSAMANQSPDVWPLAGQTVDPNGDQTKVAKSFFDDLYSQPGGLFAPLPDLGKSLTEPGSIFR